MISDTQEKYEVLLEYLPGRSRTLPRFMFINILPKPHLSKRTDNSSKKNNVRVYENKDKTLLHFSQSIISIEQFKLQIYQRIGAKSWGSCLDATPCSCCLTSPILVFPYEKWGNPAWPAFFPRLWTAPQLHALSVVLWEGCSWVQDVCRMSSAL